MRPIEVLPAGWWLGRGFVAARWMRRAGLAAVLAVLWLVAAGMPAGAHALLRESDPAAELAETEVKLGALLPVLSG